MSSMKEVLDRHKAFWNMEDVNQPLLATLPSSEEAPMKLILADGAIAAEGLHLKPHMLSPEKIHPRLLHLFGRTKLEDEERSPYSVGDIFSPVTPYGKIPWMEAIVGCPIQVSVKGNTMWARPVPEADLAEIEVSREWIETLKTFTEYLVDNFFEHYLVSATLMRGPVDMLTAVLGKKNLVMSMYRRRDEMRKAAAELADLFISVARAQLDIIPRFRGGYCNLYGLWAPGTAIRSQDDESAILSPRICREFVVPYHEKIASEFDYSMMDIHSGAELHMIDLLLEAENIESVSITIDPHPFGPGIDELIPFLSKIQERKPLHIYGEFTEKELGKITKTLSPRGLSIRALLKPH
jgi:hypothetical protein